MRQHHAIRAALQAIGVSTMLERLASDEGMERDDPCSR
jgi:hypothetical protein